MDRLLISSLFALLAALLTAVLSFVKLVNDKEGKISDFREQWTTSARQALAELISTLSALCQILEERAHRLTNVNTCADNYSNAGSDHEKELINGLLDYEQSMLEKTNESRRTLTCGIHRASQLARLHFKLNDPEFNGIEAKIDLALDLINSAEIVGTANSEEKIRLIS